MAYTAMNADRLKRKAGVPLSGRKQKAGMVYSFSLAWHPEQNPDKETMMDAAMETLGLLQLQDHEAVFVAHNDTAHPHVHVIANLIHPEHGKKAVMSYDFLTMSQWAEGVERDNGKIYCEQRVLNNEMRRNGKSLSHSFNMVKHRDKELGSKETIQQLYDQAKDGHDLKAKLQANGYVLAQGDRRGFVLVDKNDKVFSLSRQLKGQRAKDIKARLSDLEDLPHVKEVLQPPVYDRDQYETERQQKIVDAAIEAEKRKDKEQTGKTEERQSEQSSQPSAEDKAKKAAIYSRGYDYSHLRKLDAIREWEQRSDRMRAQLHRQQEVQYKREKVLEEIAMLEKKISESATLKDRLTGKLQTHKERLEILRKNLSVIDQRIQEQTAVLESRIRKMKPEFKEQNEPQDNRSRKRRPDNDHSQDNEQDLDHDR